MDRMMLMISVAAILLFSSSPLGHSDACVCPRVDPGLCPKTQLLLCESSPLDRIITLSEFCITIPGIQQYSSSQCSNQSFWEYVERRDPLKLGFLDLSLMHLVRQLLAGDPDQRLTAQEALNHPYFLGSSSIQRDLEVEQVVENDSKTPQRSLRRQCLFFHWMCYDVEEKKRSS